MSLRVVRWCAHTTHRDVKRESIVSFLKKNNNKLSMMTTNGGMTKQQRGFNRYKLNMKYKKKNKKTSVMLWCVNVWFLYIFSVVTYKLKKCTYASHMCHQSKSYSYSVSNKTSKKKSNRVERKKDNLQFLNLFVSR